MRLLETTADRAPDSPTQDTARLIDDTAIADTSLPTSEDSRCSYGMTG